MSRVGAAVGAAVVAFERDGAALGAAALGAYVGAALGARNPFGWRRSFGHWPEPIIRPHSVVRESVSENVQTRMRWRMNTKNCVKKTQRAYRSHWIRGGAGGGGGERSSANPSKQIDVVVGRSTTLSIRCMIRSG